MSIDIRDLSDDNVDRLTKLLYRRPEYGVGRPSRRWYERQEMRIKTFPSEMLNKTNFLKRLVIKLADNIHPDAVDPRAVLCEAHSTLNPWLIRRLFLAIAYEVTVHTDTLRSWKDRKDIPAISAFIGRVDAIAALWTQPELYRQCYGVPPFENHMVHVLSGCEACILSAIGANARALADLRAILIDRVERRPPRKDKRPAHDPRLMRYIFSWIGFLENEIAAKCIERSDAVVVELRNARPQIMQWRTRRRKELRDSRASNQSVYTELKMTNGRHQLNAVPVESYGRRRTRDGIPVAMADVEDAEAQRVVMNSLQDKESIFRPDSMNPLADIAFPGRFRNEAPREADIPTQTADNLDPFADNPFMDDNEIVDEGMDERIIEGEGDLEQALAEDEDGRSHVGDWYANRLAASHTDLTEDDAQSILSSVHPAFQPNQRFTRASAVPAPLGARSHWKRASEHRSNRASVWTDVSVHSPGGSTVNLASPRMEGPPPPIPRVPSIYRQENSSNNNNLNPYNERTRSASRTSTRRTRSRQHTEPSIAASSVYSDQVQSPRSQANASPVDHRPPPAMLNPKQYRRYLFDDSSSSNDERSPSSSRDPTDHGKKQSGTSNLYSHYVRSQRGFMRSYAADENPFTSTSTATPASTTPQYEESQEQNPGWESEARPRPRDLHRSRSSRSRRSSRAMSPVPSLSSASSMSHRRSHTAYVEDADEDDEDDFPPTPTSETPGVASVWRQLQDELGDEVTPWPSFYLRRGEGGK